MRFASLVVTVVLAAAVGQAHAQPILGEEDRQLLANVPDYGLFDRILADVVRDERVDYQRLGTRHRLPLFNHLAKMAHVDPVHLSPKERLAYYINLYNAWMLHACVQRLDKDPAWRADADDFAVFKEPIVAMGARKLSLNELEHKTIRPEFKDPRVHAVLVCAARSCPPLLNRAYTADDLDEVLDENMKRFVLDRGRNPIDDEKKELRLSKIFEWYADDFGGKDNLAAYVGKIAGKDYGGYSLSFVDYSWDLNDIGR